jgi:hypothetical protein
MHDSDDNVIFILKNFGPSTHVLISIEFFRPIKTEDTSREAVVLCDPCTVVAVAVVVRMRYVLDFFVITLHFYLKAVKHFKNKLLNELI